MIEYRILIPVVRDSDRQPHADDSYRQWHDHLSSHFGGWSQAGTVLGFWDGCEDISTEYRIATDKHVDDELASLVQLARKLFDQRALYVATSDAWILS